MRKVWNIEHRRNRQPIRSQPSRSWISWPEKCPKDIRPQMFRIPCQDYNAVLHLNIPFFLSQKQKRGCSGEGFEAHFLEDVQSYSSDLTVLWESQLYSVRFSYQLGGEKCHRKELVTIRRFFFFLVLRFCIFFFLTIFRPTFLKVWQPISWEIPALTVHPITRTRQRNKRNLLNMSRVSSIHISFFPPLSHKYIHHSPIDDLWPRRASLWVRTRDSALVGSTGVLFFFSTCLISFSSPKKHAIIIIII